MPSLGEWVHPSWTLALALSPFFAFLLCDVFCHLWRNKKAFARWHYLDLGLSRLQNYKPIDLAFCCSSTKQSPRASLRTSLGYIFWSLGIFIFKPRCVKCFLDSRALNSPREAKSLSKEKWHIALVHIAGNQGWSFPKDLILSELVFSLCPALIRNYWEEKKKQKLLQLTLSNIIRIGIELNLTSTSHHIQKLFQDKIPEYCQKHR
jgi:hypothetical protein